MMRIQDMPGTPPSFSLLVAINAPLALPRALWFRYLPGWWDDITFIAAIGVFWYWVALNIHSWRQTRRVFMFSWAPLRLTGDAVAVGIGAFLVFVCWHDIFHGYLPISWPGWLWFVLLMGLSIAWSVVLIFFFGRDFIHCILRKKPVTGVAQG